MLRKLFEHITGIPGNALKGLSKIRCKEPGGAMMVPRKRDPRTPLRPTFFPEKREPDPDYSGQIANKVQRFIVVSANIFTKACLLHRSLCISHTICPRLQELQPLNSYKCHWHSANRNYPLPTELSKLTDFFVNFRRIYYPDFTFQ